MLNEKVIGEKPKMTNIAKRSAKKTVGRKSTTKKTSSRKVVAKALNKAIEAAEVTLSASTLTTSLEAWATVLDGEITGLYTSRTKARNAREEKRVFGENVGAVRKALVQLV